jgi:hypothetical protein
MRLRTLAAVAAIGALTIGATAPAGAANSVSIANVSRVGSAATLSGSASFAEVGAEAVGGTRTLGQVATTPVAEPAGLVLKEGRIAPLADGSGLRFIWEVTAMPAEVPPEGVRYNWTFAIGEKQFQLQAKRQNLTSVTTTEDPIGHVLQASKNSGFFQLRGNCETAYRGAAIAGCYHLAFLEGAFNTAAKTVTMDVPYNTKDSIGRLVAPEFKPGAVLLPSNTANTSIVAGAQAVASTADTGSYINDWNPYFVGQQVQIAAGPPGSAAEELEYFPATVNPDGTFTGTLKGLSAQQTKYFARACSATACAYTTAG